MKRATFDLATGAALDAEMSEAEIAELAAAGRRVITPMAVKVEAARRLAATDWKVLRHRDQLDAGEATSLTDEEYAALLTARQAIRAASNEIEAMDPVPQDYDADGLWS